MKLSEYKKLAAKVGVKHSAQSWQAGRLMLVDGMSVTDAAIFCGLNKSTTSRVLARLQDDTEYCLLCGNKK